MLTSAGVEKILSRYFLLFHFFSTNKIIRNETNKPIAHRCLKGLAYALNRKWPQKLILWRD